MSSTNIQIIKNGVQVQGFESGGIVLDVQGTQGQLFSITDSLTGDIFKVSDISGIPIFNINSSGSITIDGDLILDSSTATATSGDYLIISDLSNSSRLTKGPLIGTDSSTYLRNDGTWATPPNTTYSGGTGISTSGTTFYLTAGFGDTVNPYGSKTANTFLAAPNGSADAPTFRAIVAADIPTLDQNTNGSAGSVVNAVTFNSEGAGAASGTTFNGSAAQTISYNTLGAASSGHTHSYLPLAGGTLTGGLSGSVATFQAPANIHDALTVKTTSGYRAFSVYATGDTQPRGYFLGGAMWFGSGSATVDAGIGRSAAYEMKIVGNGSDGNLYVQGKLGVGISPIYDIHLASDAAYKLSGGTWKSSSDERLKENIELADLDRCYTILRELPLKRFSYKRTAFSDEQIKDRSKLGWIAQEVQQVFPKAISTHNLELQTTHIELDENGEEVEVRDILKDSLSLDSDQLYAVMYGTIQKLQQKVEELEARLAQANL